MTVGSRWFKFDFHNHTPASDDYQNMDVTDEEWLLAYMRKEVDAVIISDHNTAGYVDRLKSTYIKMQQVNEESGFEGFREIVIFPGVEITATGDVHILAVFDETASSAEIEQLIGQCNAGAAIERGSKNHQVVLRNSVTQIVSFINQNNNAISIFAHIDASKGVLGITNQAELVGAFGSKPNAVEVSKNVSDIKSGIHRKLIKDLPKLRGSDAHSLERAGTRTCWLKMSSLNFDGLKSALLDHENCVLTDELPPSEPRLRLKSLSLKTRLCKASDGNEATVEFSPFYNAIIGSRGSGKSTLTESIRLAFRKNAGLIDDIKKNIDDFASIGNGMDHDSRVECLYVKDGHDYKVEWWPQNAPKLSIFQDGEWAYDQHWSSDRFAISIYSQKMLYKIASDNDAFLNICDDSDLVDKKGWEEKFSHIQRSFKRKRIELRELKAKKEIFSALLGELSDIERAIERLSESSYYTVRNELSKLEQKRNFILQFVEGEKENVRSILDLLESKSSFKEFDDEKGSYAELAKEIDNIQSGLYDKLSELSEQAVQKYDQILQGEVFKSIADEIEEVRYQVQMEAEKLTDSGLDPNKLDALVNRKQEVVEALDGYACIDHQIKEKLEEVNNCYIEMEQHRKDLTVARKDFIHSLDFDSLEVKILPLSSEPEITVEGYQAYTGINSFKDRIYDPETSTGLLKEFQEYKTFVPKDEVVEEKYNKLKRLKNLHEELLTNADIEMDIHGSLKKRLSDLSPEAVDNLLCWFPEDGLNIRYRSLGGQMEDIKNASPGQKAASMLEFLMSYGEDPLILDQPEDDLDCMMLSESVIPAISSNKKRRQLIIVSHSAPIVVNGDAEYVISMVRDKNGLRPNECGALQEKSIKELICRQMEGGEKAFRSRFNRILD
ncbi:hypothetical protein DQ400_05140 [Vreelandella sulfidaeris]|uniref:Polymerase/histidinol phosphatase N-terminal domain-containing protein n=1 Tax=Vreelandella sulfidaeris TaxID=115553 RepID=A0A365TS43_9GAMM|nr:anti-phage protein Ppl [Halomonas sulfidaeris]RBI68753.1 hypothetical protein DQ400_05140 [Halomonas sulfidaeris]